jgi:outer membrane protein OmpA-like peptidoglycan-associated protein
MDGKPVWSKSRVVTVDTAGPRFTMALDPRSFSPSRKQGAKKMEIRIRPKDRDIKSWKLTLRTKQGSAIRKLSGDGFEERLFWAGDDALGNIARDGDYEAAISAEDFAGNAYEAVEQFSIDTYVAKFMLSPETRIFAPGAETVVFNSNMKDADRIKSYDLEIRDSKGGLVKAFRNNAAGVKTLKWNGTGDKNAAVRLGSVYTYRVITQQKNGLEASREGLLQTLPPDFEGAGIELTLAAVDFPDNSKDIPTEEYGYLNQAAEAVKKYAKNYYVILRAYATDSEDPEEDLRLSIDRARVIRDYLITQGVPEEHMYLTGFGDGEFAGVARKEEAQKNGRRVEVELLTK